MRKLRTRDDAVGDEELVRIERANLIDPMAPNPSVEMMLHAFLPHKFVDHTHATAVLSLIDQPDGEALCDEVYDGRLGFVPYLMPGFGLAKKSIEVFERQAKTTGLILSKHGIVTYGESAREAYERMIEMVTLAEVRLKKKPQGRIQAAHMPQRAAPSPQVAPIVRGACSMKDDAIEGAHAAACAGIPRQRRHHELRQWRRACTLQPSGRHHAGSHHPHQKLAIDRAGGGAGNLDDLRNDSA